MASAGPDTTANPLVGSNFVNDVAGHVALDLVYAVNTTVAVAVSVWNSIPGHRIAWKYVKASHQNDPWRTLVEVIIFLWLLVYIFRNRRKPVSDEIKLTKEVGIGKWPF
jgi:serine palmitoyltransferase